MSSMLCESLNSFSSHFIQFMTRFFDTSTCFGNVHFTDCQLPPATLFNTFVTLHEYQLLFVFKWSAILACFKRTLNTFDIIKGLQSILTNSTTYNSFNGDIFTTLCSESLSKFLCPTKSIQRCTKVTDIICSWFGGFLNLLRWMLDQLRDYTCLLYTSPSPRDGLLSRMPSSA